ncbi:MAG: P-loop NTPase, partial [Actinomycetota bacterium]
MTDTNLHSVVVVAVDPTRLSFPSDDESGLRLLRIPVVDSTTPTTVFDEVVRSGAKAVCVDADVCESLALDLSKLLDETWPEIGVVLVRDPSPTLWASAARVGIRDIVAPDSSLDELLASLLTVVDRGERVSGTRSAADSPDRRRGRVIVVLSPKGGSGKTMVATNLAVSLSASNSGDTVLVDLDAVFGDVASVMGLVPDHTIG